MPIHRTRPTKNFTVIENHVLRDRRLNGELKGLLVWLLSHAPNWKIVIPAVMREMGWGRDKTYRLLRLLREFGYVYREQERDSRSGSFGEVVYFVYSDCTDNPHISLDGPVPDLPLPESSKATKRRNNKIQEIPLTPNLATLGGAEESLPSRDATEDAKSFPTSEENNVCPRNSNRLTVNFEKFWLAYGPETYMSKSKAKRYWRKMSEEEQRQALQAVSRYIADCKTNNRKRVNAWRYLCDRVYEGFLTTIRQTTVIMLPPYSPEWQAWRRYKSERGESVAFMEHRARQGHAYAATEKWPPTKKVD
jgi:hypothetical protein